MNTATREPESGERTEAERSRVRADAEIAGTVINKAWPLETFIAVNPLRSLEGERFEDAVRIAGHTLGAKGTMSELWYRRQLELGRVTESDLRTVLRRHLGEKLEQPPLRIGDERFSPESIFLTDLLEGEPAPATNRTYLTASERFKPEVHDQLNEQCGKWCAAYLGAETAAWSMPGREAGFFTAWRNLIGHDRSLPDQTRKSLQAIPPRAEDSLLDSLTRLGVPAHAGQDYLRAHIGAMPGWAALVTRSSETDDGIDLVSYLAMRVSLESALLEGEGISLPVPYVHPASHAGWPPNSDRNRTVNVVNALGALPGSHQDELSKIDDLLAALPPNERTQLWLEAYEEHYRKDFLRKLEATPDRQRDRPEAQLICCIDARSEGLRRHFESLGDFETLGFAGFFGMPIRFEDLSGNAPEDLCPVLIHPSGNVTEAPAAGSESAAARRLSRENSVNSAKDGLHAAEKNVVAPFAFAEMAGWFKGPLALLRTISARSFGKTRKRIRDRAVPPSPTSIDLGGMTQEDRLLFSEVALKTMGLTDNFAPVVIMCAHGSTTENNPYASALDCGACGGHRGGPNARTAATILNLPDIREGLRARGIEIPDDTIFIAAEHDTTSDEVRLLEPGQIPEARSHGVAGIVEALGTAGRRLSIERSRDLPGGQPESDEVKSGEAAYRRSQDWAEVYPEWGLAGNAAFLIGPRSISAGLDLDRRAFLHSYDPASDPEGEALETILTAPVVVAQWINCQYYFSTVDPIVFGAGTKTTHNPVSNVGVLSGPGGDLMLGLPWQSLAEGDRLLHEPMRLLVAIQSPLDRIDEVIGRNPSLRDLFENGWLGLAAREKAGSSWMRRERNGKWTRWETK